MWPVLVSLFRVTSALGVSLITVVDNMIRTITCSWSDFLVFRSSYLTVTKYCHF